MAKPLDVEPWSGMSGSLVVPSASPPAATPDPFDDTFPVEEERFDEVDFNVKPIQLTEGQVNETFSKWGKNTPAVLAASIVDDIRSQPGNEALLNLYSLRDGTAPYFDLNPATRDLAPFERAMSFNQIATTFSNLKDQSFLDRLKIESPRAASSLVGMGIGAKVGATISRAVAPVPLVGPYAAAAAPIITTPLGAILGQEGFERMGLIDKIDQRPGYSPDSRFNVIFGRAAADALEGAGGLAALAATIGKKGSLNLGSEGVVALSGIRDKAVKSDAPFYQKLLRTLEKRGIKLLQLEEKALGTVAASARYTPPLKPGQAPSVGSKIREALPLSGKAAAAETAIGATSVGGAGLGEKIFPGSDTAVTVGQVGAPVTATLFYTFSPPRLIAKQAFRSYLKAKQLPVQMREEAVANFNRAREEDPNVTPDDFGLRQNEKGELELAEKPTAFEKIKFGFTGYGEKRKQEAASVIIRNLKEDLEKAGEGGDADFELALDKIIRTFEGGDDTPLYNNPTLVKLRRMLERMGSDFSEKEGAVVGQLQKEIDGTLGIIATGLASDTEDGYRLASILMQRIHEADIASRLSNRAARVFEAQGKLSGNKIDAETASQNLFSAVDPLIESTADTANKLYDEVPSHIIFFDDAPGAEPLILDALTELDEFVVAAKTPNLPMHPLVRGAFEEIKAYKQAFDDFVQAGTAGSPADQARILNAQDDFEKFKNAIETKKIEEPDPNKPLASYTQQDIKLDAQANQEKYDKKMLSFFNKFEERMGVNADIEKGDYESAIKKLKRLLDGDEGYKVVRELNLTGKDLPFDKNGFTRPRAREDTFGNLVEKHIEVLEGLKGAPAAQAAQAPEGLDYDVLKRFKKKLSALGRDPGASPEDRAAGNILSNYFERQMVDMDARRSIDDADFAFKRLAANTYYKARQNVFNDGIFAAIARDTKQGINQSVELLRKQMDTLKEPTAARINDLSRAVNFVYRPVDAPTLSESALRGTPRGDVDREPYRKVILDNVVISDKLPPSVDAAETNILEGISDLIVASRKRPIPQRNVLDPSDVPQEEVIERVSELGMTLPERNAIQQYLTNSANNGLDLLPGLKQRLTTLLEEGSSFEAFKGNEKLAREKFMEENLWTAFANTGKGADFTVTMAKAFDKKARQQTGSFQIFSNLLNPIREIKKKAANDPRGLLTALKENKLFERLENVNIESLGDDQVDELVKAVEVSARNGLKSLIVDYGKSVAGTNSTGGINYGKFREFFFGDKALKSQTGTPTVAQFMETEGLLTRSQRQNLEKSLSQLENFDAVARGLVEDIMEPTNPVKKAAVSTFGSLIGSGFYRLISKLTGGIMGSSGQLVASGTTATAAREVLLNARAGAVMDGMFKLMQDRPFEIARILKLARKGLDPKAVVTEGDVQTFGEVLRRLQAASLPKIGVVKAGQPAETEQQPLMGTPELRKRLDPYNLEGEERSSVAPALRSQDVAQFQLPSQQAGFLPQLTQAAQAGAPASRPTGQPNPQQRQGLASLFPDDPILGAGRAV